MIYDVWPFRALQTRSAEEMALWRAQCYCPAEAEFVLHGERHWRILVGRPGSGKSAAVLAMENREVETSLIVRYSSERWPGAKQARVPGGNHLAQIMAEASIVIRDVLIVHPQKAANLTDIQRGSIRWLLEKFSGPRAFSRWVGSLEPKLAELFRDVPYEDLYPTTTQPLDVQGQIDELASLARGLGYQRVLITIDLNSSEASLHQHNLRALFEWLDLMHHPGLTMIAALPEEAVNVAEVIPNSRGRVSVVYLRWDATKIREIVTRHLRAALANPTVQLEEFVSDDLWTEIEKLLLAEYGAYVPAGWVAVTDAILYVGSKRNTSKPFPLKHSHFLEVGQAFFARHIPLRLDTDRQGVWRGPKFITLTDKLFEFTKLLHARQGRPIGSDDGELYSIIGNKKGNLHSLASRVRGRIEPFPEVPIYIQNKRGEGGYWLEHYV
jgi:hypothetical protein